MVKKQLPFVKQKNDWHCGPAALKMLLAFYDIQVAQAELAKKLGTTRENGTTHLALVKTVQFYGLKVDCRINANQEIIRHFLAKEVPMLINYHELKDNIGHYAVVAGFDNKRIILYDPSFGAGFSLPWKIFDKRWYGYHRTINKRWLMAVFKK